MLALLPSCFFTIQYCYFVALETCTYQTCTGFSVLSQGWPSTGASFSFTARRPLRGGTLLCQYEGCNKSYYSKGDLTRHQKLKHRHEMTQKKAGQQGIESGTGQLGDSESTSPCHERSSPRLQQLEQQLTQPAEECYETLHCDGSESGPS